MYLKVESDVIRPIKELKGFTKVNLQPNETKSVNLKLIIKDSVSFSMNMPINGQYNWANTKFMLVIVVIIYH